MKKITFLYPAGQDTFLKPIIHQLRLDKKYEIDCFSSGDEQLYFRTIHDSDLVWIEWANEQTARISQHNHTKKIKQVVRLHSYELFDGWHLRINWDKFNKLVVVNESVKELLQKGIRGMFPPAPTTVLPDEKFRIIYNGVDTDKYVVPEPKKYNKKVCFVGFLNQKKGIELLWQCFDAIHQYDNEFTFHVAGIFQDPRSVVYCDNIKKHFDFTVNFDGYISDVKTYLADKDFIISTSVFESFHYSIMEGMASGVVPLVHNWFGSDNIYPREYLFVSMRQLLTIIEQFSKMTDEEKVMKYSTLHQYVENNFSFTIQMMEVRRLIDELLP